MVKTSDKEQTFIERARRAQIVAGAIETIAKVGYGQASLARIAEGLGISKGVILYHFADKDELVKTVVAQIVAAAAEYMRLHLSADLNGAALLRTYIEANLAFMAGHRTDMLALVEITANARAADGGRPHGPSIVDAGVQALTQLLAARQARGQLRADFDPASVALALRAAIDAAPRRLAHDPDFDLERYGRELADIFDRATREVR